MRIVLTLLPVLLVACTAEDPAPPARIAKDAVATTTLIAIKIPACAATIGIGGIGAGIAAISPDPHSDEVAQSVADGVDHNCGPPYLVTYP